MTANYQNPSAFKRGIVLYHEWLIAAGGAERLAVEEYRYLVKQGIPTWLLTFQVTPRGLFGLDLDEVEIIPRKNVLDGILQLRRRLAELRPDLIIVGGGSRDLYFANFFSKIPYVLHQHEAPYKCIVRERQIFIPLLRRNAVKGLRATAYGYRRVPVPPPAKSLLQKVRLEGLAIVDYLAIKGAAAVTSLSRRAAREVGLIHRREAIPLCGALPQNMFAHEPKRSLKEICGLPHSRLFLSISRLEPMKRLDVLMRAFARIALKLEDTVLVIGGTGPEEKVLRDLAEELNLAQRIVFLGFVPDEELWDDIATCDVFICADWTDFDIAPYEALALGCRVVWSSEMETDEWLERHGAVFAVDPSVEGLAEGMQRALLSPKPSSPALLDFLQRYTWEHYFGQVVKLATKCLNERAPHQLTRGRSAILEEAGGPSQELP